MVKKQVRHILGLSGGKDSTALVVLMHKQVPQMEYFFCDTHKELPETYEYLNRIKARLGIKIECLSADENREEYISTKPNIKSVFPFKEQGLLALAEVLKDLLDAEDDELPCLGCHL